MRAGASLPGALIGRLATSRRGMLATALASSLLIGLLALQILSPQRCPRRARAADGYRAGICHRRDHGGKRHGG
jgi:hypothetical protein